MGSVAVYRYHMLSYKQLWRASLFSNFVIPLLFVASIGYGVGSYVNQGGELGINYLDYLVPGLLVSTAMQLAVFECSFPVYSRFSWSKYYFAIQSTPVGVGGIIGGELLFVCTRVLITGAAFGLVMIVTGVTSGWWLLGALPVTALFAMAVATPTMTYSASINSEGHFSLLFRFALIPLSLFSGVFFPVDQLPLWLRPVAYVSPLWHAVELCRAFSLSQVSFWPMVGHTAYLLGWLLVGTWLARMAYTRRLAR
ncbi:MAG: ABC transporter permease [Longispora sp.]|nr:ABC transporter permease [Longispora sp. (in: high G+C Gram-positive bacteria)]